MNKYNSDFPVLFPKSVDNTTNSRHSLIVSKPKQSDDKLNEVFIDAIISELPKYDYYYDKNMFKRWREKDPIDKAFLKRFLNKLWEESNGIIKTFFNDCIKYNPYKFPSRFRQNPDILQTYETFMDKSLRKTECMNQATLKYDLSFRNPLKSVFDKFNMNFEEDNLYKDNQENIERITNNFGKRNNSISINRNQVKSNKTNNNPKPTQDAIVSIKNAREAVEKMLTNRTTTPVGTSSSDDEMKNGKNDPLARAYAHLERAHHHLTKYHADTINNFQINNYYICDDCTHKHNFVNDPRNHVCNDCKETHTITTLTSPTVFPNH